MLKIERRKISFSLPDTPPDTPHPTPSSSYVPDSLFDHQTVLDRSRLQDDYNDLAKTAEDILMSPNFPHREEDPDDLLTKLREVCQDMILSVDQLEQIEKRMVMEIIWGLGRHTNPSSNIKSYITYVSKLPTGRESGSYLALDLGGTNFRVLLVELDTKTTSVSIKADKHSVSQSLMMGPGEDLFDFMVERLREFMLEHCLLGPGCEDPDPSYHLGFTFSFPTVQHSLSSADLATWTKGFICDGVVGQDVVKLLEKSIRKYPDMNIKVSAILNDTTGCLIACAYKRPDCAIGVIIGTGTNASYLEEIDNVELYEGQRPTKSKHVAINTEWGALGNTGSLDFIRTSFDLLVDQQSKNVGKQVYEKLISGMYLGELTRHILVEAASKGILFREVDWEKVLKSRDVFLTRHISEIESDEFGEYSSTRTVLDELDLSCGATELDCQVVRYICECVSIRASVLAAAGVAALINKMGRRVTTVGMDGSLYKFHPHFSTRMSTMVRRLVDPSLQFQIVLSEDGSGRGAGLAAAVSSTSI